MRNCQWNLSGSKEEPRQDSDNKLHQICTVRSRYIVTRLLAAFSHFQQILAGIMLFRTQI